MIPHPTELDAGYATVAAAPLVRAVFRLPGYPDLAMPVVSGTLSRDASQWPRVSLTLTLPTSQTPQPLPPQITPFGAQVILTMGATDAAGEHSYTAATLDVDTVEVARPDSAVTIHAASSEARVNEDRYDTVTATAAGTAPAIVTALVRRTLPLCAVTVTLSDLTAYAAAAFNLDGDVWPTIEALMNGRGGQAYFDATGSLVIADTVAPGASPALVVAAGVSLVSYRSIRKWGPNRVAVAYTRELSDGVGAARVTGLWQDTRGGETDVGGPYGRHTARSDETVPTAGAFPTVGVANAAALALARRTAGLVRALSLTAVPAGWLEPGDTVRLALLGGTIEDHVCQSVDVDVTGLSPMTVTTRDAAYTGGAF